MRILLRLSEAKLGAACRTDHLAHCHGQVGLVVQHFDALEPVVVVGHGHIVQGEGGHAVVGEVLLRHGCRDLPAAVGAEVETEHHIARANPAVHALEDRRLNELIGDVCRIGRRHGRLGVGEHLPLPIHEQRVGFGDALPPLVAVHGPVPAAHRGQTGSGLFTDGLEFLEVAGAQLGRCVPAIRERMHHHIGHVGIGGDAEQGMQVILLTVNTAAAHQAHEVQSPAFFLGRRQRFLQDRLGGDGPVRHGAVDPEQVLVDDAPGADVEVPHFAVAHLAFGQAHGLTVGGQGGVGMLVHQPIETGRGGHMHGVVGIGLSDAPAVEDDEGGLVGHGGAKVSFTPSASPALFPSCQQGEWNPLRAP